MMQREETDSEIGTLVRTARTYSEAHYWQVSYGQRQPHRRFAVLGRDDQWEVRLLPQGKTWVDWWRAWRQR